MLSIKSVLYDIQIWHEETSLSEGVTEQFDFLLKKCYETV